jgi:type IX secretion system PorP/SprF family membrane protein
MSKTTRNFFGIILLSLATNAKGQDVHFSQFYENAMLRNPALTGIFSGDYKLGSNYRNQWSSVDAHPFSTGLASFESRIHINEEVPDFLSFGLTCIYDRSGSIDFTTMQAYPAINYNKFLESKHNTFLSAGFTCGYMQRSFDLSKMTFANQFLNGSYSSGNPSKENFNFNNVHNFDLGFGLSLNGSMGQENEHNYYVGLALYHVTKPSQSFNGQGAIVHLSAKYVANFGMKFKLSEQNNLVLHANYTNQDPYQEIIAGALLSWKSMSTEKSLVLYGGIFYRYKDAIIPTAKVDFGQYSLTMSYDVTNSSAYHATNRLGGTEISLFYRGILPNNSYAKMMRCPRFEDVNINF